VRPPEALRDDPQLRERAFFSSIGAGVPPPPFRLPPRSPAGLRPRTLEAPVGRPRRALDGVRVLDFTHVVAGPVATRILADHGAEVVKVERRVVLEQGDRRRGFFSNLNRGKKSIVIDMAQARGIELARRLAAASDVVIDNFSARVMGNWGLDYEGLRALRADVIAIGLSGFGKTGPQRDYVSFGPTLQALTGFTSLMRHPGGEPAGWGYSYSDMAGGVAGALAALAALFERSRTGRGRFIDLSQLECVASLLGPALFAIARGENVEPVGNASQEGAAAPHGIYRAAGIDRWVAIAVFDDDEWRRAASAIAEPWSEEARFAELSERLAHRAELDAALERWTSERSPEEVTALFQSHGVAAFTVADGEDLGARDPHLQARGYWPRFPTEEGRPAVLDGVAAKLSTTPGFVAAPGPRHGEHTDEVLQSVTGLGQEAIDELRAAGVIA
jgi:crotonobetainyl-CoA:carnitine CoA-transferase CaiB-like acyl-CoA transferase